MAEPDVTLRAATADDAYALAEVDRRSWPASLATTADEFAARIPAYPEGQLVAEVKQRVVASGAAQRVTQTFFQENHHCYNRITDRNRFSCSHEPRGEIYQLVGVGVLPEYRGRLLGRQIVDRQLELARSLPDVHRILGFTRPIHYHRHRDIPIERYVQTAGPDGNLIDPVLAFHVDAGARIVSIHPGFRPDDHEACGYGVLIEYPR